MDRVYLQGSEDVERAGRNISGAAETMERAAATISQALETQAARQWDRDVRDSQLDPNAKTLRDHFASTASEFDVKCVLEELGHNSAAYPLFRNADAAGRNAIARFAFADAMLKARGAA